jgi:Heparinase II/III N-terminus/Heparinase II/III-like protein
VNETVIRNALTTPPGALIRKVARRTASAAATGLARQRDALRTTYAIGLDPPPLRIVIPEGSVQPKLDLAANLGPLTAHYLNHEFDLLGSGRVPTRHGVETRGIEGHRYPPDPAVRPDPEGAWLAGRITGPNARESARIWSLVDADYSPIDWQLDFKSGWRWSERTWYRDIRYGDRPGVDVKVPWELARMEHLPQLALAAILAHGGADGFLPPAEYEREFRNQLLDFIATNPPRFGVNWVTAMDVAIRVSNWLLAHDLLVAAGAAFDAGFEAILARSVFEHGRHIAENMEWAERRGNHYLADVAGLVFVAAHVPTGRQADSWLATGSRELLAEIDRQFLPDGSNFESSTWYHGLASELVLFGLATLLGLEDGRRPPLPERLGEHVRRMADFVAGITKPDGRVPQIGDNDSGRLFTFGGEADLDLRPLIAGVEALAPVPADAAPASMHEIRAEVVRALAGGRTLGQPVGTGSAHRSARHDPAAIDELDRWIAARPAAQRRAIDIPLPPGAIDGLALEAFADFGLYIARSARLYVAIRCGTPVAWAPSGHVHNDQLSIELAVDGADLIRDPGAYLYTPLPERRNAYRSAAAHYGPRPADSEPARLDQGLFVLPDAPVTTCLSWGLEGFAGRSVLAGGRVLAETIRWLDGTLAIRWGSEGCDLAGPPDGADWRVWVPHLQFSPGYGRLEPMR